MEDELARLRRALHSTDSELDLARVLAESQGRSRLASAPARARRRPAPWGAVVGRRRADAKMVEIVLDELLPSPLSAPGRPGRRALGWGALVASLALAASVVVGVALGPLRAPTPQTTLGTPAAAPSPALSALPAATAERISGALSAADISLVDVDSSLGEDSVTEVYRVPGADDLPTVTLPRQPLDALQVAGIAALRDLRAGSGWIGAELLGVEHADGEDAVRVRTTSSLPRLERGRITRIEYLVDTSTWLPRSQEIWAISDVGEHYVLVSRLTWLDSGRRTVRESDPSVSTVQ